MLTAERHEQFAFNHYRDALVLIDAGSFDIPHINELIRIGGGGALNRWRKLRHETAYIGPANLKGIVAYGEAALTPGTKKPKPVVYKTTRGSFKTHSGAVQVQKLPTMPKKRRGRQ